MDESPQSFIRGGIIIVEFNGLASVWFSTSIDVDNVIVGIIDVVIVWGTLCVPSYLFDESFH